MRNKTYVQLVSQEEHHIIGIENDFNSTTVVLQFFKLK